MSEFPKAINYYQNSESIFEECNKNLLTLDGAKIYLDLGWAYK